MAASITAARLYLEAARNRRKIRNLRLCIKVFLLVSKSLTVQ
jgi:hypothetical protein